MSSIDKNHPFAKLGFCALLGLVVWILGGFNSVPDQAWHIFSVFIAVIFSFIIKPFPMGMTVLLGLLVLVLTGDITLKESLTGYADSTVWLVVSAFLLAGAMSITGLGRRLALSLVKWLGKTMKGLAYAICGSEFLLATVMPSNTARGGGIHAPIVESLSKSLGSTPEDHPKRAGEFLSLVGAHANLIAAAMFMTGMAANPLISRAAEEVFGINFNWGTWALGAILPGLVGLIFLPHILHFLAPPKLEDVGAARELAKTEIKKMGPMSFSEKTMATVLLLMLILWSTPFLHGMGTTTVAILGVMILLISGAIQWDDVIKNHKAWDTLVWLGGLLTMANLLLQYGFIEWFVSNVEGSLASYSGMAVVLLSAIIYFYSMYAFSMLTAHIASMAVPFLAVCLAAGGQPYLAVALFAYFSCLCGCTTNYSTGPIIIYFGLGYVKAPAWFKVGWWISLYHITIWLAIGLPWWKILGWW